MHTQTTTGQHKQLLGCLVVAKHKASLATSTTIPQHDLLRRDEPSLFQGF